MLDDSGATLLLAAERYLDALPVAEGVEVVALESVRGDVAGEPEEDLGVEVDPRGLAYVIYTSGSTGRPKGIALAHRGVVNNLTDLNRRFRVGPDDRLLFLSSLSFDMSVYEVLGTLAAGAALVIPDAAAERDPAHWAPSRGATASPSGTPPRRSFRPSSRGRGGAGWRAPSIRLAFLGGDWVPVDLPARLRALAPGAEVVVMGGATEASIHSTIFEVGDADPAWRSIPYGHPMANQRVYVLSPELEPLPVHAPGELYLGGVGLARGYLDRPGATAERFVPSPFGDGERIYRTGDRVRWRADGELELLGRLDHQIKVRGFRIEAGEVESVLREHPAVRSAVVMAHGDGEDRFLAAYVVAHPDAAAADDELRDFARGRLPAYMVPAAVVVLDRLPLTPNGKLDRASLPIPRPAGSTASHAGPMSATEEALAAIWSEVLRVPVRGAEDDFFDLGGHSLLAARVASRVGQRFGVELSLADLFQLPTVRALAALVDERAAVPEPEPAPPEPGSMAQLLSELESLSDAEVRALLEATGGAAEHAG
jgi:amino acid adenylation domain-containing protein